MQQQMHKTPLNVSINSQISEVYFVTFCFVLNYCFGSKAKCGNDLRTLMTAKMPYLNEDEIVVNGKTATNSISNTSDVDDAEESFFENKVNVNFYGR